uniref:Uncharacterized protein n=1 Tax=Arundo donax TaxID=35708 RepID=A0A0A8ZBQ1_ARUDO
MDFENGAREGLRLLRRVHQLDGPHPRLPPRRHCEHGRPPRVHMGTYDPLWRSLTWLLNSQSNA